jgi:monofunctional chorismate mutase
MTTRAARGAITVADDSRDAVLDATERLLKELLERNAIGNDDVVSLIFTATEDITSVFPAEAARRIGLVSVPLMCMREMAVQGALARCVRVLLHFQTEKRGSEITHVYLEGARALRHDLG